MRPTGLAETPHQHRVGGLEENDLGRNHPPDRFQDRRQLFQLGAFADIHDQRGAANFARLHRQFGKLRDQFDGKIVDAVVAEIFEGLQHRGLPRPAHAGDDDQFGRSGGGRERFLPGSLRALPGFGLGARFMNWIVASKRRSGPHVLDCQLR